MKLNQSHSKQIFAIGIFVLLGNSLHCMQPKEYKFIYGRTGKINSLLADSTTTIRELKGIIAKKTMIPVEAVIISDKNRELSDSQGLREAEGLLYVQFARPYTTKLPKWTPTREDISLELGRPLQQLQPETKLPTTTGTKPEEPIALKKTPEATLPGTIVTKSAEVTEKPPAISFPESMKQKGNEAIAKLKKHNVREKDQEILWQPLPSQFSQYQDQYYSRLINEILAYDDSTFTWSIKGEGLIKTAFYNLLHPSENVYPSLAIRFILFAGILNIEVNQYRGEADKGELFGLFFGKPEYFDLPPNNMEMGSILNYLRLSTKPEGSNQPGYDRAMKALTSVYKIHLNPADQFLDYIVCKMLYLKSRNKDFFEQHKLLLKIKLMYCAERKSSLFPLLIIYTRGKQTAQETLNFIYDNFKNDRGMGCDWAPDFNEKVTDLIYFAQSDRDLKKLKPKVYEGKDLVYFKTGLTRDAEGKPVDYTLKNPASPK